MAKKLWIDPYIWIANQGQSMTLRLTDQPFTIPNFLYMGNFCILELICLVS